MIIKKQLNFDVNPNWETLIKKQVQIVYDRIHFQKEVYSFGIKRAKIQEV